MAINSVTIKGFRNLDVDQIDLHPRLNFLTGLNASGKTSFLESIYFLSTARSFRTHLFSNIVRHGNSGDSEVLVFGEYSSPLDTGVDRSLVGIKKSKTRTSIRINGEDIRSTSFLAALSPTLIIDPDSLCLLSGSSKVRRKFVDWGVFHVEHQFSQTWNQYIYCLKQRNTLLRAARIDNNQMNFWEEKLTTFGQQITDVRSAFFDSFHSELKSILKVFEFSDHLYCGFHQGWDKNTPLSEFLFLNRQKDFEKRYTQFGPHRFDMKILTHNRAKAQNIFSRGQQKILVTAMYLTMIKLVKKITGKNCIVLIDDINSELDKSNLKKVFQLLLSLDTQVICTSLDIEATKSVLESDEKFNMFHVEHGNIIKI